MLNESNWNEEAIQEVKTKGKEASQPAKYRASKCLAEKCKTPVCCDKRHLNLSCLIAAWAFYEQHKADLSWDLVTLCPPYVCSIVSLPLLIF